MKCINFLLNEINHAIVLMISLLLYLISIKKKITAGKLANYDFLFAGIYMVEKHSFCY